MATPHPPPDPALKALAWLLELAAQRAGYTVHGLPGWADAGAIESGARTWGTSEIMRAEARRGHVHAFDARAPGERRPRWVYRISGKGSEVLTRTLGGSSPGVADPELATDTGILVRESAQHAIAALRAALDPAVKPLREWVPGQAGWRSSWELTDQMAREDEVAGGMRYRWFTTEDLRWLVQLGLIEKRVVGRIHVYRLLPAGAALKPLAWREPHG